MKNWLQKTWGRILLLAMLVLLLALTTRWWLLPVLNLLDANSDRLQSLDSIVSLLLVIGGLVLGFLGLRRRNEEKEVAPVTQIERYLDFRGMGMSDRVALKLSLLDMYVPLKARVERP